jgi:8-oxo-dGTP pyrophosphatase MutT (NUDIX family)
MKKPKIRAIALCLFSFGDRILVSESADIVEGDRYCRPLGGGIEFGESSATAMQREIREEIGGEIENLQLLGVIENRFIHEGKPGHEIVFLYDAEFIDRTFYQQPVLHCHEHDREFVARWQSLTDIQSRGVRLVPPEILPFVQQRCCNEPI